MLQFVGGSVVRRLVLLVGKRPSILVKDKVEPHTFLVRTEENRSMAVNIISLRGHHFKVILVLGDVVRQIRMYETRDIEVVHSLWWEYINTTQYRSTMEILGCPGKVGAKTYRPSVFCTFESGEHEKAADSKCREADNELKLSHEDETLWSCARSSFGSGSW